MCSFSCAVCVFPQPQASVQLLHVQLLQVQGQLRFLRRPFRRAWQRRKRMLTAQAFPACSTRACSRSSPNWGWVTCSPAKNKNRRAERRGGLQKWIVPKVQCKCVIVCGVMLHVQLHIHDSLQWFWVYRTCCCVYVRCCLYTCFSFLHRVYPSNTLSLSASCKQAWCHRTKNRYDRAKRINFYTAITSTIVHVTSPQRHGIVLANDKAGHSLLPSTSAHASPRTELQTSFPYTSGQQFASPAAASSQQIPSSSLFKTTSFANKAYVEACGRRNMTQQQAVESYRYQEAGYCLSTRKCFRHWHHGLEQANGRGFAVYRTNVTTSTAGYFGLRLQW